MSTTRFLFNLRLAPAALLEHVKFHLVGDSQFQSDMFFTFFENVNGLPTNINQQSSFKYKHLHHLLNKLEVDLFSFVKT